ncbi:N-formylglutamate amidohydrolase [Litoreibacter janthinus]|uniref:Predicted N-formylglutamate amidohydrolase n=1 Tax=Litoreibacter janthinus TaxID=670154 RepID=A0A1I6GVF6_9RHOB|nr:N-formylglutamate amidohydrolase [Litoreibacter janthinus]SFR46126.1 Predicted N-formylglutamate amidohydrolase [Litoreibacter janthinus]
MNAAGVSGQLRDTPLLSEEEGAAYETLNADGRSPVVFVCEHASNRVPASLNGLGLTQDQLQTHVAWDPGASKLARRLSAVFNASLIEARFSRLVYDCNRPPDAPSAMPADTEVCPIPGNAAITPAARAARAHAIYEPFHREVSRILDGKRKAFIAPVLVTIHSFTPVFHGQKRDVEIGLLHAQDNRLADALMQAMTDAPHDIRFNAPYGPEDGVLHSIEKHLLEGPLPYVMIEVRNDLLASEAGLSNMSALLARSISHAVNSLKI